MGERLKITGPQGRRLEVEVAGPEDGEPLVFHCGTPSAGLLFAPLVRVGAHRGLRHITYSRPGYGASSRHASHTVADCASDVAAIADGLGFERFFTLGWSGGGPHALACAALLPGRVLAAASIAGVAPWDAEGLDWLRGMGQENLDEFAAAEAGEEQLLAYLNQHGPELASATGAQLHSALGDLLSEVDSRALTGEFAEYLAASGRAALAHGVWGWFDDDMAFMRDWGFDLGAITRPVTVWHGAQDRFVPVAHGRWLAAHVAGARAQLRAQHGHVSLATGCYGDVLDDLMSSAA
jgi:pimeloyl-ACP methyl ester carboxylesterase